MAMTVNKRPDTIKRKLLSKLIFMPFAMRYCPEIPEIPQVIPATSTMIVPLIFLSIDRKSTRLNSSHVSISYAVFCLKKKNINKTSNHNEPVVGTQRSDD